MALNIEPEAAIACTRVMRRIRNLIPVSIFGIRGLLKRTGLLMRKEIPLSSLNLLIFNERVNEQERIYLLS